MGNILGVMRDFQELEKRRMRAIGLWEQGETQAAVARRVGVVPQTVARWVVQYRRHGKAGLERAGRAGRKPQMNQQDRERLHVLLREGTEALGYEKRPWTCLRVADLIKREFGVRYHPGHVWKILAALGWSPQRPADPGHDLKENETLTWKGNV
jgi:transposase